MFSTQIGDQVYQGNPRNGKGGKRSISRNNTRFNWKSKTKNQTPKWTPRIRIIHSLTQPLTNSLTDPFSLSTRSKHTHTHRHHTQPMQHTQHTHTHTHRPYLTSRPWVRFQALSPSSSLCPPSLLVVPLPLYRYHER